MSVELDRNTWATPWALFRALDARFAFTVDACALLWNAKVACFWTPEQDGLKQDWSGERVWCNLPYGRKLIVPWVAKALKRKAEVAVLLLPARTEMFWFHDLLDARAEITFLRHRIRFEPPAGVKASSPLERSFVAVVHQ